MVARNMILKRGILGLASKYT